MVCFELIPTSLDRHQRGLGSHDCKVGLAGRLPSVKACADFEVSILSETVMV
jgi:hypothetical protein